MRLLHTADWHLGRLFHGRHLTEDQAHVLDQFVDLAADVKPDAVLVSGDVFDRSAPPVEAVALLDEVLSRLTLDLNLTVILIAGNHDNPVRLSFNARVLEKSGLYIRGGPDNDATPIIIYDRFGPASFYTLPYLEPAVARQALALDAPVDHHGAMTARLARGAPFQTERNVLLTHAFAAGGSVAESERPLSVGGLDQVGVDCFTGFSYTALGHLHRPQSLRDGRVNYSGSLMKYSFSEAGDPKSVSLVEIDGQGRAAVERVPLTPKRDLRRIEGTLSDLLAGPGPGENPDDYLLVSLTDQGAVFDAMGRLREVYPNVLHIERPFIQQSDRRAGRAEDYAKLSELDLFSAFFQQVAGRELTPDQREAFIRVVEDFRQKQRVEGE